MIVDDEQSSIDLLQWLIGQYCPDITAIKTARSVQEGAFHLTFRLLCHQLLTLYGVNRKLQYFSNNKI